MILEIIFALILGVLAGTLTGLIPGIHINLLAAILLGFLASSTLLFLEYLSPIILAVFIASMAITHTFLDFIPSIYLGAPEEDTFLSILPGHEMLKQGSAHEAVILTLFGSLFALLIILIFTPVFIFIVPFIFNTTRIILPFLLIFISFYLIFRERKIISSLIVFSLAGFLGFFAFNLPIKEPLLPLLTGLFGSSSLIISIKNKIKIQEQKIIPIRSISISKKDFLKSNLGSLVSAPLCSFLPGIGAGHAAVIGSEFIKQSRKGFLVLLGGINTIVMGLSFITLYSIGRTRTGAAVAIQKILEQITFQDLIIIISTIIISGFLASILTINISKIAAKKISKINYNVLSFFIIAVLSILVLIFSNILGFVAFITASALGVFTILSEVRRINLMGVLLVPTILFYLF